jgi:putative phosphoribosyl transferase
MRQERFVRDGAVGLPAGAVALEGNLRVPEGARGIILLPHGNGGGSVLSRFMARELQNRGLATLLFDLLTPDEEERDALDAGLRFDVPLLAERLENVAHWVRRHGPAKNLPAGVVGAGIAAAASLMAAAGRPQDIAAIVSRGGRPDLAADELALLRAPTLFIVGGADRTVLAIHREAFASVRARKRLAIVPGASHLFEEAGAPEAVVRLATAWLFEHLTGVRPDHDMIPEPGLLSLAGDLAGFAPTVPR